MVYSIVQYRKTDGKIKQVAYVGDIPTQVALDRFRNADFDALYFEGTVDISTKKIINGELTDITEEEKLKKQQDKINKLTELQGKKEILLNKLNLSEADFDTLKEILK